MKASEPDMLCSAVPRSEAGAAENNRISERLAIAVETEGLRSWLERVRVLLNARSLSLNPAGDLPLVEDCVSVGANNPELRTIIDGTFQKRVVATPAAELGPSGWTIMVPIQRDGALCAVLATQGNFQSRREVQAATAALQVAVGWILYRDRRLTAGRLEQVLERSSDLLLLIQQAGKEEDPELAVRVAVDGLRAYFQCDHLYLGWARGSRIRLAAISGVARVDPRSVRTQPVEAAMRESLKLDRRIDYQAESVTTAATAAHGLLLKEVGAARLTSLPLLEGRGVLLMQWNKPISPELDRLIEAAAPSAIGLFGLLRKAHPFPGVYPAARIWKRAKNHQRLIALLAIAGLGALLAWPFPYPIRTDCQITPTVKRVVTAPFDGQLRKTFVEPGDQVEEGQILGNLESRELLLKEAELTAGRDRALKQRDKAMSDEGEGVDFAAAQLAQFEAQRIGEELSLVKRRLALLEIRSPLRGVVLSGDLRRVEGQPVQQGQQLFEIAPLDRMIVETNVPDHEISYVRLGMNVDFRLDAFGKEQKMKLTKLHPQSELREGRNIFVCEGEIGDSTSRLQLRPGMRGQATIWSDTHPLVWIIGHRLWDWIQTTLFL
jgi:multidrug resistance efflux pump